jgi:hypothetical protein
LANSGSLITSLIGGVEPRNRPVRRAAGGHDADIAGLGVVRQAFLGERRHGRQCRRALGAGDAERHDLVALQQVEGAGNVAAVEIDLAAVDRENRGSDAAIRHVQKLDAGLAFEQLHAEMVRAALADGGEARRIGLARFGKRDELLERPHAERALRQQHVRRRREIDHRRKLAQRVVGQGFEQARIDRHAGVGKQQRVAVRRSLGHGRRPDGVARAWPVLDDHRHVPFFVELLRECAGHRVDGAAGIERHDDLHRPLGKLGARLRRHAKREQGGCGDGEGAVFHMDIIGDRLS